MQLVDQPGPVGGQVGAPLVEQRQHRGQVLDRDRGSVAGQRGHARRRGSVDHIVLATATARELPHPSGGGARHVIDLLTASGQPLREVAAQAAGVLHGPPPGLELGRPARQLAVPGKGGVDLQRGEYPVRSRFERAGGMGPLVWINSDDDHERPPVRQHGERDRGRHADFQHPR
ncbi:MAG TPA: hypothetical protein VHS32_10965 [Streptosporangiaceae bacterium]|nr:hypothetical protein [Streptosporangiaceae bacterium]